MFKPMYPYTATWQIRSVSNPRGKENQQVVAVTHPVQLILRAMTMCTSPFYVYMSSLTG